MNVYYWAFHAKALKLGIAITQQYRIQFQPNMTTDDSLLCCEWSLYAIVELKTQWHQTAEDKSYSRKFNQQLYKCNERNMFNQSSKKNIHDLMKQLVFSSLILKFS